MGQAASSAPPTSSCSGLAASQPQLCSPRVYLFSAAAATMIWRHTPLMCAQALGMHCNTTLVSEQ